MTGEQADPNHVVAPVAPQPVPPAPGAPAHAPILLPLVTARRCDGSVATVLGKPATATNPWFFTADDGTTYIVKLATATDRTAFNEVFFGRLAKHIELRVPQIVALKVSPELIADDPSLARANFPAGIHVGVARLPSGSFDLRGGVLQKLGDLELTNGEELPGTVVFSSWIEDSDHVGNDGNWMLEPTDDNKYIVWMIDFGHALGNPRWSTTSLRTRQEPGTVRRLGPHPVTAKACAAHPYEPALDRINAIAVDQLNELLAVVPADWQPGAADREALSAFLMTRRSGLAMFRKQV